MRILLVESDTLICDTLTNFLENEQDHEVTHCNSGMEALEKFKVKQFPMVITDINIHNLSGIELMRSIKSSPQGKQTDVVLIVNSIDYKNAINTFRDEAYDILCKPIDLNEVTEVLRRVTERQSLLQENYELKYNFEAKLVEATSETQLKLKQLQHAYMEVVGIGKIGIFSGKMHEIVAMAERLHADRSIPVLIEGETGTGKEVIARLIHYGWGDTITPFIPVNCSAIAPTLFESELFGYEGGSFTGANKTGMMGKFELAQGGTLFLDEIAELPMDFQTKLLRAIEEKEIYRIGGQEKVKLNIRIICASNRNISHLVQQKKFRQDLYYRLNTGKIYIPPLREMPETIIPLVEMFLKQYSEQKKRRFNSIHRDVVSIMENYLWPGNVRELQNAIERVVLIYDEVEVRPEHLQFLKTNIEEGQSFQSLPFNISSFALPADKLNLKELEVKIIQKALIQFKGNKAKTAAYLGISRSTLQRRIKNDNVFSESLMKYSV